MIISRHMEILLNLRAVSGKHDLRGLCWPYNEAEANVRNEGSWGGTRLLWNHANLCVDDEATPEIRLIVTRKASGEHLELETLQAVFEEELVARERSRDPARNNRHPQDKPRPPPTATTLLSGTQESSRESIACCYCQQSHCSVDCRAVTNLDARRQILKTSGRCFNCLMREHVGRKCRSPLNARLARKTTSKHL